MGSSKYKKIASTKNSLQKDSSSRPKYYDEKIQSQAKKSSVPVAFFIVILVVGFGVFGIGKLIDFGSSPAPSGESNDNTFYQENTGTITDDTASSSYLTPISIVDIDGTIYNLSEYEGKVVVLYFHFLGCTYCYDHSPNLAEAMGGFSTNQLLVLSISVDPGDTEPELENWASNGGYSWPIVRDTDSSLAYRFGATGTPLTVYLDPTGAESSQRGVQATSDIVNKINSLLA